MTEQKNVPSEAVLLEEYRQAMSSQRSNTSLIYSWTGNIFLVLSTGLFFYGTTLTELTVLLPTMILAFVLVVVWWGMTETFIFYIRQRMRRIHEIEKMLDIRLMSGAGEEIRSLGRKARFVEARTYVRLFILAYVIVWILMFVLRSSA
ncbi:MAG: hypothetical protein FJY66_02805 [Calditrichaeota bacterium]|nr:hypothetical protein [Calditrichota bacterium]